MRDRLRTPVLIAAFFFTSVLLYGVALYGATSVVAAPVPSVADAGTEVSDDLGDVSMRLGEAASTIYSAVALHEVGTEASTRWPWVRWERRRRSPQMTFRQVLPERSLRSNRGYHRDRPRRGRGRVVIETRYHFRVQSASRRRARAVLFIDAIVVRRDGRRIGVIRQMPRQLRRARVTIFRNGRVRSDRRIVVVGEQGRGFELAALSTRRGPRRAGRPIAVAEVQLRRGRAVPVRRSLFLRDRRSGRPVPILTARAVRNPEPLRYRNRRGGRYRDRGVGRFEDGHPLKSPPASRATPSRVTSSRATGARGATRGREE